MPPDLTRVTVEPLVYFAETAVTVIDLQTTTLHFGRWAEPIFEREAASGVLTTLLKKRPGSQLWALGVWLYSDGVSMALSEKLFQVGARKRAAELEMQLVATASHWSGRPRGNYLLRADRIPQLWTSDETWFVQDGDVQLSAVGSMGGEPGWLGLARSGATIVDFDQDSDLLICELVSNNGHLLASYFEPWINPEGLIL